VTGDPRQVRVTRLSGGTVSGAYAELVSAERLRRCTASGEMPASPRGGDERPLRDGVYTPSIHRGPNGRGRRVGARARGKRCVGIRAPVLLAQARGATVIGTRPIKWRKMVAEHGAHTSSTTRHPATSTGVKLTGGQGVESFSKCWRT